MLTREMKAAIRLLKEIHYTNGYVVRERSLPEASRVRVRNLLDALCHEELLNIIERSGDDPLYYRYSLLRNLNEVTLCTLLPVTGDRMHFSSDSKAVYDTYGMAGRKLGVVNQMVHHFLSQISIIEIILPEEMKEDVEEGMNENPCGCKYSFVGNDRSERTALRTGN